MKTSKQTPFQIFEDGSRFYKRLENGSDLFVYPINESDRGDARVNFSIDRDEEILMIRDTSTWDDVNEGTVLTDQGFHFIFDNGNVKDSSCFISWEEIEKVEYQEQQLYFCYYDGGEVKISMYYFLKDREDNVVKRIGLKLASLFTEMAQAVEPQEDPIAAAFGEWDDLQDAGKYEEAYKYAKDLQTYDLGAKQWLAFECAARSAYMLEQNEKAIEEIDQAIEIIEENSDLVELFDMRYRNYKELGNDKEARKDCLTVKQLATNEEYTDGTLMKDYAAANFKEIDKRFVEGFLDRPYNERKVLLPVKKYTDLYQDIVNVIEMANLPEGISFPTGHPIANQLYIGHPLLPHLYIPFENYQLELIEDKLREFCYIAQAWGATEIIIKCINDKREDYSGKGKQKGEGELGYKAAGANASRNKEYSNQLEEELSQSIQLHQTFTPTTAPYLPKDLVWFYNEPKWHTLYKQRMAGSFGTHTVRIETRKSQMIESNELTDIKGEIKTLLFSAKGAWEKSEQSKYQIQENAVLEIKVNFAPWDQLTQG